VSVAAVAAGSSEPSATDDAPPPEPQPQSAPRELTLRAILVGCGIGVLLAAGNVYTSVKTGYIDGGSISAAVLGFSFFAIFRRRGSAPYSQGENNITQTTAASAAVMSFVLGAGGPLSALTLMGQTYPGWLLFLWTVSLGLLGILLAVSLRNKLIVVEELPFPTGTATAEVIETIHAARHQALHRARLLSLAGIASMYVAWFRDGPPGLIPQAWTPAIAIGGLAAANMGIGVSWSPLLASTGVLMGLRGAASMLLGAAITWLVIAPRLFHVGLVSTPEYSAFVSWLVWPSVGMMLPSAFLPLILDWRSAWRSMRDLSSVIGSRAPGSQRARSLVPLQKPIFVLCLVVLVLVVHATFAVHPLMTLLALAISVVTGGICARAAGETDFAPVGQLGTAMQLGFGARSATNAIVAGGISMGTSSQVSQTLWAFKAGKRLNTSPRAQVIAQIIGALVGALVVVPVYFVVIRAYKLGSEVMPATAAISWKATAEAVQGGLASLPKSGPPAAVIGIAVGTILTLLGRSRYARFVPSPTAIAIAFLSPMSLTVTVFLGALGAALFRRRWPKTADESLTSAAAGGVAGESLMGVLIAALIAFGII
jgi:uncharacterized oligopeptide transporter (OPT) family protein